MKKFKSIIMAGAVVATICAMPMSVFASSAYSTPAEAVAGLTGRSVESVTAEHQDSNKTYGTIAKEAGKLDEFKKEVFEIKKDTINKKVADGDLTQEKADEILAEIQKRQETCDGTRSGERLGLGFGKNGDGQGKGNGQRNGNGRGMGRGLSNGTCTNQ